MGEVVAATFAVVREAVPEDDVTGWVVETWARNQSSRQRQRTRPVIRHLLDRCRILLAVPAADPTPSPDGTPFGWMVVEPWDDGSETVHFVYVRGRVPSRGGAPASPSLRGLGIAKLMVAELGDDVWYTTACPRKHVPSHWRFDSWR